LHGQFDARRRPSLKRPKRVSLKVFGSEDWRTKSATHRVRRALAPRLLHLSSEFFLPSRLPCILFLLCLAFFLSLFLSFSYSIFVSRYKMSYSYENHITRDGETRSVFTKPRFMFVIFFLLINHASPRYALLSIIVKIK